MKQSYVFAFLCAVFSTAVAFSQPLPAKRTFVSGTGNDAHDCSRITPCRTFPVALTKTAAGGEIIALDSGGFGGSLN
jgi:hypothetical protein